MTSKSSCMTRPGPKLAPLNLTDAERAELERWVRRRKGAQDMGLRGRLILACEAVDEGGFPVSTAVVAAQVGVTRETVGKWRRRFLKDRLAGLEDEPRPGRPMPSSSPSLRNFPFCPRKPAHGPVPSRFAPARQRARCRQLPASAISGGCRPGQAGW
ncbi:transposase [Streptomyces sp. NPDC048362]|uniref:helix-turn-helix domain-containing protein n=1 Tax=Streptomyces sp. NPDC048362 TaxID=3365539 RepID=UPI0037123F04